MHVAAAPLLEGEKLWGMAMSSEQAAALATPSTSKSPPITPANSEATPQPRRRTCTRAPKPSCIAHEFQSGRVVHPGTSPPSPRAQPVRLWGLHRRPRGSRGSDDGRRRCADTHSQTPTAQRRHSWPETADADAPDPCTLAEAKRSPKPHRSRRTSTPPPPSLSPQTKYPRTQQGSPSHAARPVAQGFNQLGVHRRHSSLPSPHSLGGRQAGPPPPFGTRNARWHARQGEQPTGGQSRRSQRHGQEPACHTRAHVPYRRHHPPSLIFEAAAHHWERQCHSQPRARPLGDSRVDSFRYLPDAPDPRFRTCRGQQPTEGPSKRDSSIAVDQRATSGRAPLTIESDHVAPTHSGKEASQPRSPVSAPPSGNPTTPLFKHRSGQSPPPASGTTTTRDHPHPSPHGRHKQPTLSPRPSPQALCLGPWPMREVRGSVAKLEIGPWAPGQLVP